MDDYTIYLNQGQGENLKQKEIYFFCYLQTILNKSTKRGAILKSISIGTTKLINLNNFSAIAKFLLEQIFSIHLNSNISESEKLNYTKILIQNTFDAFNKIPKEK